MALMFPVRVLVIVLLGLLVLPALLVLLAFLAVSALLVLHVFSPLSAGACLCSCAVPVLLFLLRLICHIQNRNQCE